MGKIVIKIREEEEIRRRRLERSTGRRGGAGKREFFKYLAGKFEGEDEEYREVGHRISK